MMKNLTSLLMGALMVSFTHIVPAQVGQSSGQGGSPAAQLRAKHASIADALKNNPYKRPMHIESTETSSTLKGDVYALLPHPFAEVSAALTKAGAWCDIMIMPVNTKDCRVAQRSGGTTGVTMRIGRKFDQPLKDAYPIDFTYRVAENSPEYFAVRLDAENGPLSTKDYRVMVEATPVEGGKTFLHLRYSYGFGMAGRIAMQAYLSTAGASKVGFSSAEGNLVGGMRGVVERNTMRYYLAIESYLGSPGPEGLEKRLQAWFDATEQYARQLREIDRNTYLAMKRKEVQRQQTAETASSSS
jgi:hypothetical protein